VFLIYYICITTAEKNAFIPNINASAANINARSRSLGVATSWRARMKMGKNVDGSPLRSMKRVDKMLIKPPSAGSSSNGFDLPQKAPIIILQLFNDFREGS
jgi:hypothetical protein